MGSATLVGRPMTLLPPPLPPAGVWNRPEPPGALQGGAEGREPGHCREGRVAMLRGPTSWRSLAPVSITWPSVYSLSAAEMRLELTRWLGA